MGRIVLYIHAQNWEDPWSRLGLWCKEVKKAIPFLVLLIQWALLS